MAGGLTKVRRDGEQKVLFLADSNEAIDAVKKAGRTGRARSRHLQKVVNTVAEIKEGGSQTEVGEGPPPLPLPGHCRIPSPDIHFSWSSGGTPSAAFFANISATSFPRMPMWPRVGLGTRPAGSSLACFCRNDFAITRL